MMAQEELLDFKALRAKFQQEDPLKLMNKPAIPQKPKVIPPPPSGTRVNLISSINAAVESKTLFVPRVVFKDDKQQTLKPTSPTSPTPKSKDKEPGVKPELIDKKQKREGDAIKQAMKDKNLPLVLPVPAPAPVPEPATPSQPAKPAIPRLKGISFFKKPSKPPKVKAEGGESVSPPGLPGPPSPPSSGAALVVDTPASQKPLLPPIPVISPTLNSSGAEAMAPVVQKPLIPAIPVAPTPPSIPDPVIPDTAVAAPDVTSVDVTVPEMSTPSIPELEASASEEATLPVSISEVPASEISALSTPDLETTVEAIPEPDIPSADVPTQSALEVPVVPELEVSVSDIPAPEMSFSEEPDSEIFELDIPAPVIPPPDIPDSDAPDPQISDLIIPDPVIEDVDITAPSIPDVTSLDQPNPIIPSTSIPATDGLAVSRTPSPEQIATPEVSFTPLPSELPPAPVEFAEVEDVAVETKEEPSTEEMVKEYQSSGPPKPLSALSALVRAEEISPAKKTSPSDQRILNLLEKAKRKYATHHATKAPSPSPSPSDSPIPPIPSVSVTPTPTDHTPSVSPIVLLPDLPPVDYEDSSEQAGTDQGRPVTLLNGFEHRQVSPILEEPGMEEAQAEVCPATQVKKPLPPVPSRGPAPDRPPVDLGPYQLVSQIPEAQEEVVNAAPEDLSPEEPALDPQSLSPEVPEFEDVPYIVTPEVDITECGISDSSTLEEAAVSAEHEVPAESLDENYVETDLGPPAAEPPEVPAAAAAIPPDSTDSPVRQDVQTPTGPQESPPETTDDVYEDVTTNKKKSKKRKSPPKNPYAETQPPTEETQKSGWFKAKKSSAEIAEEKEQKKREKQREKEREKEREREKKEQKERQKKENEMKKKFKLTGQEKPIYEAKVCVASKGKNNELPVKSGDMVSIIRTTNCPKGKWLAMDSNNKYGYIPVKSLELDIKEMLEMGKRVKATGHVDLNNHVDGNTQNMDSGMSNHYELGSGSFSDDDEWNDDDEQEPLSPTELTHTTDNGLYSTLSMPETVSPEPDSADLTPTDASTEDPVNTQARHEALQKLATFFRPPPGPDDATPENNPTPEKEPSSEAQLTSCITEEVNPEVPDLDILPPPDLYADVITEESLYTYGN